MDPHIRKARILRTNSTDAESWFWRHVRNRQFQDLKFRRQQPIPPYVVDFFCEEHGLIIEIDGGQHGPEVDGKRDAFLDAKSFKILRYWNNDVLANIEGVLSDIKKHIGGDEDPSPKPSPDGRGLTKRILIGKVVAPHGIKGDVKIACYADDPELLFADDGVFTDETSQRLAHLTPRAEPKANLFIARVEGIADRNAAEAAKGMSFYIDRAALPALEDGAIYHSDLEGMDVVSAEGKAMGKVLRVQNFGAGDLLEVTGKKENYYLPFAEPYLVEVDLEKRIVVMNEPEVL